SRKSGFRPAAAATPCAIAQSFPVQPGSGDVPHSTVRRAPAPAASPAFFASAAVPSVLPSSTTMTWIGTAKVCASKEPTALPMPSASLRAGTTATTPAPAGSGGCAAAGDCGPRARATRQKPPRASRRYIQMANGAAAAAYANVTADRHLQQNSARACGPAREADIIHGPVSPCWLPSFKLRPRPNAAERGLIASRDMSGPMFVKHSSRRLRRAALGLIASAPLCLAAHAATPPPAATAPATPPGRTPAVMGPIPAPKPKVPRPQRKINWLNPTTWPILPVPLTAVDPNSGTTLGIIPTMLVTNSRDEITDIIAPDFMHNPNFGWGAHGRILAFPSQDTQWSIVGGGEQRIESTLDAIFQTGLLRDKPFSLTMEGLYDRSGTPRFYGIGNNSFKVNQTVFTNQQLGGTVTLGWNITHAWQLAYTFSAKKVKVLAGDLKGIPPITEKFADLIGIGTTHELLNRVALIYDTRDDI